MKVAYLTSVLSSAAGGLGVSVPSMAVALNRLGDVEPHVVGTRDPIGPRTISGWGPHVHALDVWGPSAFRYMPELAQTLRELDPDLIDVQGLWTYPSLASLRHHRRTGKPYLVTPRGMLDPWALNNSRLKKGVVRAWFENDHLRGATCLRATAEMEASHFRSFGLTQPIAVVPNGVDIPPTHARHNRTGPRRLLFLSRVHPKKGIPDLLRLWRDLQDRHPDWELVVAGPDERGHTAEMQGLASRLKLDRLSWPGPIHGAAKEELYNSSSLFVLPTHAENFGLVVAEALAHAVPVVTTRNAPWDGIESHACGRWVDLKHSELLEALDQTMKLTDSERAEMGLRGRDWMMQDFSWTAAARQMAEAYRWILTGGPQPDFVLID